ncbi:hypothetical protein [Pedobacter rhodius]|uniref:Uncharacterized protein n=1 Tax=Pedobacter rhodius TaxID=3004098 RepID=A0ABT4KX88_9SPHI|nr:hypothetical protein [Pedobacter sp. SJ11]MCZ4223548.1 hypothetical protein [Pedobacter sp. SJ11]
MFFWLNDVELAIERVKIRVSEGGHSIPEDVIRRRYFKGIQNLKLFIQAVDFWFALNNSAGLKFIAEGKKNEMIIFDNESWAKLK